MEHNVKRLTFVLAALILSSAASVWAATVYVGACMPTKVSYDNLTDAVQGVPPGSTILVCPGTYAEQIVISKSLTIKGVTSGNSSAAVLASPPAGLSTNAFSLNVSSFFSPAQPFAAQIVVSPGVDVTITGMIIDGAGPPNCSAIEVGLFVQDSNATVNYDAFRNQLQPSVSGCATSGQGVGVLTQNDTGTSVPTTMKVSNSSFANAGQSFESDGAANTSTVTNNFFNGNPASNANAISILNGASTVQGNSIANFTYPAFGNNVNNAAFGALFSCVTSATVSGNFISNTQVGVFASNTCTTSGVSITGNDISGSSVIGIDVGETNGLVQGNDIRNSLTAIRFPAGSAGNVIQNNRINNACTAFGSNPAAGVNSILSNTIYNATNLSIVNSTALCP